MKNKGKSAYIIGVVAFLIIWFSIAFSILIFGENWADKSYMFTAISSIFSVLALLGTVYTLNLQRKELVLQRKELKQNRTELSLSSDSQMDLVEIEWLRLTLSEPLLLKRLSSAMQAEAKDAEESKEFAISYFFLELLKTRYSSERITHIELKEQLKNVYIKDPKNRKYLEARCMYYKERKIKKIDCSDKKSPMKRICLIQKFKVAVCEVLYEEKPIEVSEVT